MHSAIYRGWLRHRRREPRAHAFRYPVFMMYLDLAELDQVFRGRWLWSARRPAPARFDRADHLGDQGVPLDQAVRDLVAARTGERPAGPIRLLTHLRCFGYGFNPISLYFCFDPDGERVQALVAEVSNTPWGERHCYVLSQSDVPSEGPPAGRTLRYRCDKAFHVSPFMPMRLAYDWVVSVPGERLAVHIALHPPGQPAHRFFDATLNLARRSVTAGELSSVWLRFPLITFKVIAMIHWQALRLWLKRMPVHAHPAKAARQDP
jgi:uncharacterized protein